MKSTKLLNIKFFKHLNGTKAISSVIVFRPSFIPTKTDNFIERIIEMIVKK